MTQQNVDQQETLRASKSISRDEASDGTVVRETRPLSQESARAESAGVLRSSQSIRAEKRANMLERYGGFYWGADLIGFAVATFFTILFLGIVGAIVGAVGFQLHAPVPKIGGAVSSTTQNLGIGALVGSLVALFLAYLIGGYAAGRMARFSGARQGLGVVIWTVIAAVILGAAGAILGNQFNVASQLHLKIDPGTLTAGGVISLVVALIVMLVAATLGGSMGERYHRAIDRDAEAM